MAQALAQTTPARTFSRNTQSSSGFRTMSWNCRFFKDGSWWEVESRTTGPDGDYCYCRRLIPAEVHMFKSSDIQALPSLGTELGATVTAPAQPTAHFDDDRGSGRCRLTLVQSHTQPGQRLKPHLQAPLRATRESFKLLAMGSRQCISDNINELHLLGYAHSQSWSRIMPAPKRGDFMSILTKHTLKPSLN